MRRPFSAFLLFLTAYLAVPGWGWFQQTETGGELPGHAAKIEAVLRLLGSGDFAWFPDYLTGSPSATLLSFILAVPVYAPALLLAPPALAMKATGLLLLALGGIAAFAFGRRLARDGWTGFAVGCAYLLAPQLLQRLGWQEHMTIIVVVPLVPLTFLALLRVAERGTPFDGVLLGVSFSAALLAWSKMGAALVIPLRFFALWQFVARPECRAHLLRGAAWAIPTVLLLGVVPLLPLLRERDFMTAFEMNPFRVWQGVYSVKTATSWFDRAGELFAALPREHRVDRGAYYLGLVGFLGVAATIRRTWTCRRDSREFAAIRFFLVLALAMFWISFGPRSVLQGHFEFLRHAQDFPDIGIPLHWLALAASGVLLYWCLPVRRWRMPAFLALYAIYLFVPVFRLLERLPVYADLRAPDTFWILNGTFSWAVASALAVVFVLRTAPAPARVRPWLAAAALLAACVDLSPYVESFHRGGLRPEIFAHFRETTEKLRGVPGRTLFVSGRYFFLDVPNRSARPLATEALNHYLTPAPTARLQAASFGSTTGFLTYLALSGVSDVVLERNDPDVTEASQKWFRSLLPLGAENADFVILSNPFALYPGFFAESAVPVPDPAREAADALAFAQSNHLVIASPPDLPAGNLSGMQPVAAAKAAPAAEFSRLDLSPPRTPQPRDVHRPGKAGWVVLDESWHPDWKATVDGVPTEVHRAAAAFPAVPITAGSRIVAFHFAPPAWYAACLVAGSLGWLAALAFLLVAPRLPRRFANPKPQNP